MIGNITPRRLIFDSELKDGFICEAEQQAKTNRVNYNYDMGVDATFQRAILERRGRNLALSRPEIIANEQHIIRMNHINNNKDKILAQVLRSAVFNNNKHTKKMFVAAFNKPIFD